MNQKPRGTVKETGAKPGDILIGVDVEANAGLVLQVREPQSPREGGRIQGPFKVCAPGGGRYSKGIREVLNEQRVFKNAESFLEKVRNQPDCARATHIVNAGTLRLADQAEVEQLRVDNRE